MAEIRHLPQKMVFDIYLIRYSFPPQKSRVRSIRVVRGWIEIERPSLNLQGVPRTRMFRP